MTDLGLGQDSTSNSNSDPESVFGTAKSFVYEMQVPFGDCDPAGIVYFPRFFDYFHRTMEQWFEGALGIAYYEVVREQKIGFPTVHTEADFRIPSQFGDRLQIELTVSRLGKKSFTLAYRVRSQCKKEISFRVVGQTICAFVDLDPTHTGYQKSVALPSSIRSQVESFMGG